MKTLKLISELEALIFDMDGVIVDSEPLHMEAIRRVCESVGIPFPASDFDMFRGRKDEYIFSYITEHFPEGSVSVSVADLIERKRVMYAELSDAGLPLVPGVEAFLGHVRKTVPKVGLVTSSYRRNQQSVFERFGLSKYFDTVVVGDDVSNSKPDPEPYLLALSRLEVVPGRSLVIEDSGNGVLSAKTAGCRVVGITTSLSRETLLEKGADHVVDSFEEMYRII